MIAVNGCMLLDGVLFGGYSSWFCICNCDVGFTGEVGFG